jgi:hypothetical protein
MPDFEGEKGYHWMKLTKEAINVGVRDTLPRKPARTRAERSFKHDVERRLNRAVIAVHGVSFDENGRIIREDCIA